MPLAGCFNLWSALFTSPTCKVYNRNMRVEPHTTGSIVHVTKRGARGLLIVRDEDERIRFVRELCYLNDTFRDQFWDKATRNIRLGVRPESWPNKEPLCNVVAWTLLPNHFHMILREISVGGIAKFMQKLCGSMSTYSNLKHKEKGSLFQGGYRGRTADLRDDAYLRNLFVYVLVKNVFECHPKGFMYALNNFEDAFAWGLAHSYSSLSEFMYATDIICAKDAFSICFESSKEFKSYAKEVMLHRREELKSFEY